MSSRYFEPLYVRTLVFSIQSYNATADINSLSHSFSVSLFPCPLCVAVLFILLSTFFFERSEEVNRNITETAQKPQEYVNLSHRIPQKIFHFYPWPFNANFDWIFILPHRSSLSLSIFLPPSFPSPLMPHRLRMWKITVKWWTKTRWNNSFEKQASTTISFVDLVRISRERNHACFCPHTVLHTSYIFNSRLIL